MELFHSAADVREWSLRQRAAGKRVGFVPTMGYLHDGHLSLVDHAKKNADVVVVSIFVNPTQFGPNEDFESYPRDEERDLQRCRERGVDVVFFPSVAEMYSEDYATYVTVDGLTEKLCGASRPGHFRGVATIVTKLFHSVLPDVAVFGQKDAQQVRVIQRMTEDLQFGISIVVAPIVREEDGLAMSSRNIRLAKEHRAQAPTLRRSLLEARKLFEAGEKDAQKLIDAVRGTIAEGAPDGEIDYAEIVGWNRIKPIEIIQEKALLAIAVRFGEVRLIDNTILEIAR